MKALLINPKTRMCLAIGAAAGIGHALFRGMTANLGPVWGMLAGTASVAAVALVIVLLLNLAAKRAMAKS
jgi:hypothetical protein